RWSSDALTRGLSRPPLPLLLAGDTDRGAGEDFEPLDRDGCAAPLAAAVAARVEPGERPLELLAPVEDGEDQRVRRLPLRALGAVIGLVVTIALRGLRGTEHLRVRHSSLVL